LDDSAVRSLLPLPVGLGQSAPDPGGLPRGQRVRRARRPDRAAPADRLRRRHAGGPVRPALAVRGKNRAGSAPGRRPPAASPSARQSDRAAGRDASWRPSPVGWLTRGASGSPRPPGSLPRPTRRRRHPVPM